MYRAVTALIDAKADVNIDLNDPPLLTALQHRCIPAVDVLTQRGAKVSPEVLEEMKNISGTKARHQIEDLLSPSICRDKSLRCPLWVWVQAGGVTAVEALLRNSAHDEEVDTDVVVALQRCRGIDESTQRIEDRLQEFV